MIGHDVTLTKLDTWPVVFNGARINPTYVNVKSKFKLSKLLLHHCCRVTLETLQSQMSIVKLLKFSFLCVNSIRPIKFQYVNPSICCWGQFFVHLKIGYLENLEKSTKNISKFARFLQIESQFGDLIIDLKTIIESNITIFNLQNTNF